MKQCTFILATFFSLLLSSCMSTKTITKGEKYPKMYEEKPTSVIIMPPINQTNFVEAKDFFYTTMYMPLCEKGYYVFSPYLTLEMLQTEGGYDSELFLDKDLSTFKNFLGADAAMFTIIKSWKRNTIGGKLTVEVEYIMRSTTTGETLYQRGGMVTVDTNVGYAQGGLMGALVNMAVTAISTAATDKVVAGRKCTAFVLGDMPVGRYSPNAEQDMQVSVAKDSYVKAVVK